MLYKINVLNNFAKFTGNDLCWSLGFRASPITLLKKASAQVFSCEFAKYLKTPFLQNTSGSLLLGMRIDI